VIPNFLITESFVNFAERAAKIVTNPPNPVGGYIELPTGPGLGIEIDESRVREHTVTGPAETRLLAAASDERCGRITLRGSAAGGGAESSPRAC
jgi:Enolase C-terminal domain-like